jgi:hypothetical protein
MNRSVAELVGLLSVVLLLSCEGVVHLRTCGSESGELRSGDRQYYFRDSGGVRIGIAASAISSPKPSGKAPFSFSMALRNTGLVPFSYSCEQLRLTDGVSDVDLRRLWVLTTSSSESVALDRDTLLVIEPGQEIVVGFTAGGEGGPRSWDYVWLMPGGIVYEGTATKAPLDSICLRRMTKGVDY